MITENLSTLKIYKLTQEQYDRARDAGNLEENALYLTPDDTPRIITLTRSEYNALPVKDETTIYIIKE